MYVPFFPPPSTSSIKLDLSRTTDTIVHHSWRDVKRKAHPHAHTEDEEGKATYIAHAIGDHYYPKISRTFALRTVDMHEVDAGVYAATKQATHQKT